MHRFDTAQIMYSTINNPENILKPHLHACSRNTPKTEFISACAASPITIELQCSSGRATCQKKEKEK